MNIIMKELPSFRNQVFLIKYNHKYSIIKKYRNEINMTTELLVLTYLKNQNISVPRIKNVTYSTIILEYLDGETINSLVEKLVISDWIDALALWFSSLHNLKTNDKSLLKKDVNLKNFIYHQNKVYGLDFEEIAYGCYLEDLALVVYYILTNKPELTLEKKLMVKRFLIAYQFYSGSKIDKLTNHLKKAKRSVDNWRRLYRKKE